MKKIILLFAFIITIQVAYSQTYHKLIRDSVYWDELKHSPSLNNTGCYNLDSIKRIFFEGDTIIKGETYSKIWFYNYETFHIDSFCPPFEVSTQKYPLTNVFLREDTSEQKVYILNLGLDSTEFLLYDFSLELGDTFHFHYEEFNGVLFTTSVDSVFLGDSIWRKRIEVIGEFSGQSRAFIEGIGNMYFGVIHGDYYTDAYYRLLCYRDKQMPIFGPCNMFSTDIGECIKQKITIVPNPTRDKIEIKDCDIDYNVEIYNSFSIKIFEENNLTGNHVIDLSGFPPGIYFIRIINLNCEQAALRKIIKI